MICLDTCFIIDLLRGLKDAERKTREIDDTEGAAISVISIFELSVGLGTLDNRKSRERAAILQSVIDKLLVLQLDQDSVEEAARIMLESRLRGKPVQQKDALIAGTCISRGIRTLVTRDVRRFSGIGEIRAEPY